MLDKLLCGYDDKTAWLRRYKNLLHPLHHQISHLYLRNNPYQEGHPCSCANHRVGPEQCMALCIPGSVCSICGLLYINKLSCKKRPAYRGVVRSFIGVDWILRHISTLTQVYSELSRCIFTFCQSDFRLVYKNN